MTGSESIPGVAVPSFSFRAAGRTILRGFVASSEAGGPFAFHGIRDSERGAVVGILFAG